MSLNWKEIDAVLEDLSLPGCHIQKIRQPDFQSLVLELYRPENPFMLFLGLGSGETRLHRTARKPEGTKTLQRFAQFLRSRVQGGRITAAVQVNGDRIIKLTVVRSGEETFLWIRLWSSAANIIATDSGCRILDAFYRRPGRAEISGGSYNPENEPVLPKKQEYAIRQEILDAPGGGFSDKIAWYYETGSRSKTLEILRRQVLQNLRRQEIRLASTLSEVEKKLENSGRSEDFRNWGSLIMANLHRLKRGDTWLNAEPEEGGGEHVAVELDPQKTPVENAETYFTKSKKARQGLDLLCREKERLVELLRLTAEEKKKAEETESADELRSLVKAEKVQAGVKEAEKKDLPGLQFQSRGFAFYVGRNDRENDELLRKHVRGNDYWLHIRDYAGAYVFIKCQSGKSVPLDVLLDAGNLALLYSKGRQSGQADVYYTRVKYLRRAKDAKRGLVIPTQEKNLHIRLDMARIEVFRAAED